MVDVTSQLALFVEAHPNGNGSVRGGSLGHGPKGLLKALIERGLREDALEAAAALVVQMDAEPIQKGAGE
jgi:hypothetical protein